MQDSFNAEFARLRPQLRSFLLRMTASAEDAEDLAQDTYLRALDRLPSFRGEASLKTWIFAIGANLAKDRLRAQKRWPETVTDICRSAALANRDFLAEMMQIRQESPQGAFEIREHIAFCFTCVSKSLPLEQHIALLLKEVYEFRLAEIAEIMGESEAMVKYHLHAARSRMTQVFEGRCALINQEGPCHQCSELNGIFNPRQKAQEEAAKIAMVRAAASGEREHLFDLRMELVRGIDPFESGAAELQLHHLAHNRRVIEAWLKKSPE